MYLLVEFFDANVLHSFFTFVGIFLEVSALWAARNSTSPVHEKNNGAAETRAADAPAATA